MDVLVDKGYHTGEELQKCEQQGITTYISPKAPVVKDSGLFPVPGFIYSRQGDTYTRPGGEIMRTNKVRYAHSGKERTPAFRFQRYTTTACKTCVLRDQCTKGKANGRVIDRSEYAGSIERKLNPIECNRLFNSPVAVILCQEGYFSISNIQDTLVGNGYPVGVLAQVPDHVLSVCQGRFAVNHPFGLISIR